MGKVDINRSVHLALRDKNYEETLGLLKYAFEGRSLASRQKIVSAISRRIETAYMEARFALRGVVVEQRELDFIRFLRMFLDGSHAIKNIVDHEGILNQDSSFLNRFLSDNPGLIREFKVSHRERARSIINGLKIMARATEKNFLQLKKDNFETLSKDEQRRYTVMYSSEIRGERGIE
jgi:hypothetical protein